MRATRPPYRNSVQFSIARLVSGRANTVSLCSLRVEGVGRQGGSNVSHYAPHRVIATATQYASPCSGRTTTAPHARQRQRQQPGCTMSPGPAPFSAESFLPIPYPISIRVPPNCCSQTLSRRSTTPPRPRTARSGHQFRQSAKEHRAPLRRHSSLHCSVIALSHPSLSPGPPFFVLRTLFLSPKSLGAQTAITPTSPTRKPSWNLFSSVATDAFHLDPIYRQFDCDLSSLLSPFLVAFWLIGASTAESFADYIATLCGNLELERPDSSSTLAVAVCPTEPTTSRLPLDDKKPSPEIDSAKPLTTAWFIRWRPFANRRKLL